MLYFGDLLDLFEKIRSFRLFQIRSRNLDLDKDQITKDNFDLRYRSDQTRYDLDRDLDQKYLDRGKSDQYITQIFRLGNLIN